MEQKLSQRMKESLTWLSVQVQFFWALVWLVYTQLPPDVMIELNTHKIGFWVIRMTLPAWMGIGQAVMTYGARIRKGPPPKDPTPN